MVHCPHFFDIARHRLKDPAVQPNAQSIFCNRDRKHQCRIGRIFSDSCMAQLARREVRKTVVLVRTQKLSDSHEHITPVENCICVFILD